MKARLLPVAAALVLAFAGAGCNKSNKINTASPSAPPAGPVELKLKWTPGERIVQEFDMTETMLMNLPGAAAPVKQDMNLGQKFSINVVNAGPDGSHELEMEFLGARVGMEMRNIKMNYDSDKDSATSSKNPLANVFAKVIGCKIQYYLDASNNVERMEGVDELMDRVSTGDTSGVFKSMFNEGYFKQMMSLNRFLPPHPVQPGDTWPVKIQFPMGPLGTMDMNYNLTFKGWEKFGKRNCVRIEMDGTIETEPGASPGPMGMTMAIRDGNSSGVLWFDPELGTGIGSKMNQDMTVLMTIPKNPRAGMGAAGAPQTITNQTSQVLDFKVDSLE